MFKFSGPAERMWVNQPSASQPCHKMHGCRVLAITPTLTDSSIRVYFVDGPLISAELSPLSLSYGWPEVSRFDKAVAALRSIVRQANIPLGPCDYPEKPETVNQHGGRWAYRHEELGAIAKQALADLGELEEK